MPSLGKQRCPTPAKKRYATWESAYDVLVRLRSTTDKHGLEQAYACRCGWWHLSSNIPREDR